jgi:hypothetical protein
MYDKRQIIPDLVRDAEDALSSCKPLGGKWSKVVEKRLPEWLEIEVRL